MNDKNFSVLEALSVGWRIFTGNLKLSLAATVVYVVAVVVVAIVFEIIKEVVSYSMINLIIIVASEIVLEVLELLVSLFLDLGMIKFWFNLYDDKGASIEDLFSCGELLPFAFVADILYTVLVLIGFILLIIPGIIWAIKYLFWGFVIVDDKFGPIQSLRESAKLTRGVRWKLLWFIIVVTVINVIALIPLGLGLFVTVPWTSLAFVHIYRTLKNQSAPPKIILTQA